MALAALLHDARLSYVGKGVRREAEGTLLLVVKDDGSVVVHNLRKGTNPDFWMGSPRPRVWVSGDKLHLEVGRDGGQRMRLEGTLDWTFRVESTPFEAAEPVPEPAAEGEPLSWTEAKARAEEPLSPQQEARFEALRAWRLGVAREQAVSAFIVVPDRALREIARRSPATREELRAVPGMGAMRVETYGEAILGVLREGLVHEDAQAGDDGAHEEGGEHEPRRVVPVAEPLARPLAERARARRAREATPARDAAAGGAQQAREDHDAPRDDIARRQRMEGAPSQEPAQEGAGESHRDGGKAQGGEGTHEMGTIPVVLKMEPR